MHYLLCYRKRGNVNYVKIIITGKTMKQETATIHPGNTRTVGMKETGLGRHTRPPLSLYASRPSSNLSQSFPQTDRLKNGENNVLGSESPVPVSNQFPLGHAALLLVLVGRVRLVR